MTRRIVGILMLLILTVPLVAFGEIKVKNDKTGGIQYKSDVEWKFGEYFEAEAEATNFLSQGTSRKFLKMEIDGLWQSYVDKLDRVEYMVNDKPQGILVEKPRYYVSEYGRELKIFFAEEGIDKIAALQKTDEVTLIFINQADEKSYLKIPKTVLEEWLTVYTATGQSQ